MVYYIHGMADADLLKFLKLYAVFLILQFRSESETREVKSLDGIWNFVRSNESSPTEGIREKWYQNDLSKVTIGPTKLIALLWYTILKNQK